MKEKLLHLAAFVADALAVLGFLWAAILAFLHWRSRRK
jgi:hypothetical protein